MRRLGFVIAGSFMLLVLTGCPGPQGPKYPAITFTHLPPMEFNVAEIKVVTKYRPPMRDPNVDHIFPVPPLNAVERWVKDRLRATGSQGSLTITILDASAIETKLELTGGIKGALTKEQSERYDVAVSVEIMGEHPVGKLSANASARITRGTTVREDATVNDREETWYNMTKTLMADFNLTMETEIRRNFKKFLK
jgi:hypothetical protein